MSVNIAGVEFKNPVMEALQNPLAPVWSTVNLGRFKPSGRCCYKRRGKCTLAGNPTPRIAETYGGMINAIGLQNRELTYCKA